MVTAGWLSSAVEKVCANLVGMVVFLVIILVITPPMVSIPSDKGVTSSSSTSLRSPDKHLALNGSTHGHGFIGVHVLARLLAEQFLDLFLHLGHAGHAADQNHVMDVGHLDAGVLDGGAARRNGALDQFFDQAFQLGAGQLDVQVFGAGSIGCDVGQVDVGLGAAGQLDLGLFGGFLQALQGQHILAQINALFFLELGNDEIDDALVKVFTTQEGVAVGGQHFELLFAIDIGDFDDGDVERTAAQVVHGNLAVALFVLVQAERPVRQR
jgi:hypothetical protein